MSLRTSIRTRLSSFRNRALALLVAHLLGYLVLGSAIVLPGIPDDEWAGLDQWLRTAVFAVMRPRDTTPVTYVDIDNALYRDTWGMPTVTPRKELLRILRPLARSGASMIVVDIDLAWGERSAQLADFLEDHDGPAKLVFVRHLEDTQDGLRDIGTPYDDIFRTNDRWLSWAHAYFMSDGDGALRDWLPWLAVCHQDQGTFIPAVATLVAGQKHWPETIVGDCPAPDELETYPIIYTEEYGFASAQTESAGGLWLPDPGSPARKLPASYLLDGTNIDFDALFKDRVAIVGGSHTAGQDLRLTPLGVLPGAVVQANTILHAKPQLASGEVAEWSHRLVVAALFLVLCLVTFPLAAITVILVVVVSAGLFSHYAIFELLQAAVLLFIQFRVLAWIAEPFWKDVRESGWRILLPDYLRGEEEQ